MQPNTPIPFIRKLYANSPEEVVNKAEKNFRAYVALVKKIAIRIAQEKLDKEKMY